MASRSYKLSARKEPCFLSLDLLAHRSDESPLALVGQERRVWGLPVVIVHGGAIRFNVFCVRRREWRHRSNDQHDPKAVRLSH